MPPGARRREVNALQQRLDDHRQRRAHSLQRADRHRRRIEETLRHLAKLGVPAPAPPTLEEHGDSRRDAWSPPTEIPQPPRGWRVGPPDFVGVGVARAGTSWWFRMLTSHPKVLAPRPPGKKELHFFYGYASGVMPAADIPNYHARLPRPPGQLVGEWTPGYMFHPWMPRLLAQAAPDARLLVMLRDPIDRYRSGLSYSRREGKRPKSSNTSHTTHAHRGLYFRQLRLLLRHFPRSQLLVAQYEKCRAQPAEELRRVWSFLGADPDAAQLPDFDEHVGYKVTPVPLDRAMRDDLVDFFAEDVASLVREFPEIELDRWPNFRAVVRP